MVSARSCNSNHRDVRDAPANTTATDVMIIIEADPLEVSELTPIARSANTS